MVTQDDPREPIVMASVLIEIGYRSLSTDQLGQCMSVAYRLQREHGIDARILRLLWAYAKECGKQPTNLFAYWLAVPRRTMAKIAEMRTHSAWIASVLDEIVAKEPKPNAKPAPIISLEERRRRGS